MAEINLTSEQIQELKKRSALRAAAEELRAKKTEPVNLPKIEDSPLPEKVQRFGAGVYTGMAESLAGPIQFTLDAVAPEAGQAFTSLVNKALKPTKEIYGKDSTAFDVGKLGGGAILPLVAIPAGGVTTGGIISQAARGLATGFAVGSSQYSGAQDPQQRETERSMGGTAGAVVGGATAPLLSILTKGLAKAGNAKEINNFVEKMTEVWAATNPALQDVNAVVAGAGDTLLKQAARATKSLDFLKSETYKSLAEGARRQVRRQLMKDKNAISEKLLDDPVVSALQEAKSPAQKADIIIKGVMDGNKNLTDHISDLMGRDVQKVIGERLVNKGMTKSIDLKSGKLDPVKLMKFFDEEAGPATKFIDKNTQIYIRGIRNLISEKAQSAGESPQIPQIPQGVGRTSSGVAVALGLEQMLMGHGKTGLLTATGGVAAHAMINGINRALRDNVGRTFLAAAANARPGSPRMVRVMEALTSRFIAPEAEALSQQMMTED